MIARSIRRAARTRSGKSQAQPKTPVYVLNEDGSYRVLHPTKGWRVYSASRAAANQLEEAKRAGRLPWWAGISAMDKAAVA